MAIVHLASGGLPSEFSGPQYFIPTDGSASQIDMIVAAIIAQIDLLGLTSKDEAGADVAILAESQMPPIFESVDTPVVKVFYDVEEADAGRSRNVIRPRVTLALCQHSKTAVQLGEQSRIREILRDQFLGKRLLALPGWVCVAEAESGVMDMRILADHFRWVSAITLEFAGLQAKG